jgi:hypothetical protein
MSTGPGPAEHQREGRSRRGRLGAGGRERARLTPSRCGRKGRLPGSPGLLRVHEGPLGLRRDVASSSVCTWFARRPGTHRFYPAPKGTSRGDQNLSNRPESLGNMAKAAPHFSSPRAPGAGSNPVAGPGSGRARDAGDGLYDSSRVPGPPTRAKKTRDEDPPQRRPPFPPLQGSQPARRKSTETARAADGEGGLDLGGESLPRDRVGAPSARVRGGCGPGAADPG